MESIRWLLTVAEVEVRVSEALLSFRYTKPLECVLKSVISRSQFDEMYLTTREQYEKLLSGELV